MNIYAHINKLAEYLSKTKFSFIILIYRYIKIFLTRNNNVFTKDDKKIKGGRTELNNADLLCKKCNSSKGNK